MLDIGTPPGLLQILAINKMFQSILFSSLPTSLDNCGPMQGSNEWLDNWELCILKFSYYIHAQLFFLNTLKCTSVTLKPQTTNEDKPAQYMYSNGAIWLSRIFLSCIFFKVFRVFYAKAMEKLSRFFVFMTFSVLCWVQ